MSFKSFQRFASIVSLGSGFVRTTTAAIHQKNDRVESKTNEQESLNLNATDSKKTPDPSNDPGQNSNPILSLRLEQELRIPQLEETATDSTPHV
jgi:hypothetical protein